MYDDLLSRLQIFIPQEHRMLSKPSFMMYAISLLLSSSGLENSCGRPVPRQTPNRSIINLDCMLMDVPICSATVGPCLGREDHSSREDVLGMNGMRLAEMECALT